MNERAKNVRMQLRNLIKQGANWFEDCGLVIEENIIDEGPEGEIMLNAQRQRQSRLPDNLLQHDKGPDTFEWKKQKQKNKVNLQDEEVAATI